MEDVIAKVDERDAEFPDEVILQYSLFCYDLDTGQLLWRNDFHEGNPPVGRHRKNSYTSETPVTDGEAVYVYVAFQGLYAFDMEGDELWKTPLEPHQVYLEFGAGASPALHGDRLFILNDNQGDSFVAGYGQDHGRAPVDDAAPGHGKPTEKVGVVDAVRLGERGAYRARDHRSGLRHQLRSRR